MKLLRVGEKGSEIVAALDKDQKIRDLSSKIKDLNPETLNFKVLQNLEDIELEDLPEINSMLISFVNNFFAKLKCCLANISVGAIIAT